MFQIRSLVIVLALLLVGGAYIATNSMQIQRFDGPVMTYKDDGLHPKEIAIAAGETVTFVNKSSHAFWPASDNHPDHSLYTEFDAGRPIAEGDTWQFTFDEEGVWWLHDHLRPYFRARVVVGDVDPNVTCLDQTGEMTLGEKQACWERELSNTLEEQGAKEAFAQFTQIYNDDPEDFTVIGCHWIAHKLGETEYGRFLTHQDFSELDFPPESIYCGYGYYHGFLEHFLRDNPDYDLANNFCEMLIEDLEDEIPRIRLNCYHAIGHGFVPEPLDIEIWGHPKKLVSPALDACGRIEASDARVECFQGTFNVIADWMWNNQFGLYYPEDTPLEICELFEDHEVNAACYYEVAMRLNPHVDNNIVKAYDRYISQIPDEYIAGTVLNSFAASAVGQRIFEDDFSDLVLDCRKLPDYLHVDCMKGLTGAFIAHGEPEREYVKAIDFCSLEFLTDDERDVCYWNIIRTFKGAYTKDKVAQVCTAIEEPYREYCSPDYIHE